MLVQDGKEYIEICVSPIQDVAIRDLRNDSFDIFREQAVLSKRMDKKDIDSSNEQLLDSLNLLDQGMLKRAAVLLFHHNPEKWIPGSYVKIGYFETDSELRYQDEIHGSFFRHSRWNNGRPDTVSERKSEGSE